MTVNDNSIHLLLLPLLVFSYTSLLLAKHLSPAFIRIAGPSTKRLQYSIEEEQEPQEEDQSEKARNEEEPRNEKDDRLVFTPTLFTALNDWLTESNLTPIFAINDLNRVNGSWDPLPWIPLLELSELLNLTCHWQLGYGKRLSIL